MCVKCKHDFYFQIKHLKNYKKFRVKHFGFATLNYLFKILKTQNTTVTSIQQLLNPDNYLVETVTFQISF